MPWPEIQYIDGYLVTFIKYRAIAYSSFYNIVVVQVALLKNYILVTILSLEPKDYKWRYSPVRKTFKSEQGFLLSWDNS